MIPRPKYRRSVLFAAMLTLAVSAPVPAAGSGEGSPNRGRIWPLEIPISLSSSFGEFRSGHLHAGVDIKTFGREGVPCHAVDSGYVSRLRASPFGYGKALYIKLHTGETVVYAHLSEFSPPIDSVLYQAQVREGRYRVDIYLESHRLPVKRGDVLGYTGRTGTAAPHLHFEVRDARENPLNPLDIGWELQDNQPPDIRRVQWLPLSPSSRVDGVCTEKVVTLDGTDANTFVAPDTTHLNGRIGLAVQVIDRLGENSGRLAPYRVELSVDGRRISSIELKSFTYDHTQEVELAYDMARARSAHGYFLYLFRRRGETLWHRVFENDGVIDTDRLVDRPNPASRIHTAVITVMDRRGNVSVASLPFAVVAARDSVRVRSTGDTVVVTDHGGQGDSPARWNGNAARHTVSKAITDCFFFEDMVSFQGSPSNASHPADTGFAGVGDGLVLSLVDFGERRQTLTVECQQGPRTVHLVPVRKGERLVREFPDVGVGISTLKESLYSDGILYVAGWDRDVRQTSFPRDALSPVTSGFRLGPESVALKGSIEIRFATGRSVDGREAVYRFDERKSEWSYRSSFVRGDTLAAFVRQPGIYAVFIDSIAPHVAIPRVEVRRSHATGDRFREIVIGITDEGSGLDVEALEVYLNGNKQIARWDGFSEKTFVLIRNQNIIGLQDLAIKAVDRVGNASKLDIQIHIPALDPKQSGVETDGNAP